MYFFFKFDIGFWYIYVYMFIRNEFFYLARLINLNLITILYGTILVLKRIDTL